VLLVVLQLLVVTAVAQDTVAQAVLVETSVTAIIKLLVTLAAVAAVAKVS
jgi:hypothetical protein